MSLADRMASKRPVYIILGDKIMAKEKFTEGQTVIVIGPPKDWDENILYWNNKMAKHIGKQYKIKDVIRNGTQVRLNIGKDEYPWLWHTSWISPVVEYTLF